MTSNYNSEDFIIQALSGLVLPPGVSDGLTRLKISSSILIQLNINVQGSIWCWFFPNDFNNGMFGISKYFFLSKFLVFNVQIKSTEGASFVHFKKYYVGLTLVEHLISEKYVTFKCDKSFWNDILRGFWEAWGLRVVWVAITYLFVIIALGPMSYPPHNLCSS